VTKTNVACLVPAQRRAQPTYAPVSFRAKAERTALKGLKRLPALALCAAFVCASKRASAQDFTTTCSGPNLQNVQAQWGKSPAFGNFLYTIKGLRNRSNVTGSAGWNAYHRPEAGFPNNYFDALSIRDTNIINYSFWGGLLPTAFIAQETVLSALTCPNGECLISPVTGCRGTYNFTTEGPKVSVVGDSLIQQAELCEYFGGLSCAPRLSDRIMQSGGSTIQVRRRVFMDVVAGMSFFSWLNMTREHATTAPRVGVIAFGTNDATRQAEAAAGAARDARRWETVAATLASVRAMRTAPANACVVLVTVAEKSTNPNFATEAGLVNSLLDSVSKSSEFAGHVQIADFAKATRDHCGPSWMTNPNLVCDWFKSDHIHLLTSGNQARNDLILAAMERCLQ